MRNHTRFYVYCAVFGVIIMIIGYFLLPDSYKETTGVVTSIEAVEGSERRGRLLQNEILVAYSVDGNHHEQILYSRTPDIEIGQPINIYYSQANPLQISDSDGDPSKAILFVSVGLLVFLYCSVSLYKLSEQRKRKITLLARGRRVMADVVEVVFEKLIFSRRPDYLTCKWTDEKGVIHLFKSATLEKNVELNDNTQIAVYLDPNNYKKYYVDLDSLRR